MKTLKPLMLVAVMPAFASGAILGDLPDETHAWAVHDPNRPRPPVVTVGARGVPSDAVVLLDGTEATYRANWRSAKKEGGPAPWKVRGEEIVSCDGSILSVREFGDCQVHVEWCAPDDENPQHGNSGVYLMDLYEVQIINSHEIAPGQYHRIIRSGDEQAGCVYGQKPPLVNPIRRPGEWQTYDIVFHQPIHGADGKLIHPGTLTVFFNGVLVQDNRELEGPTLYMQRTADQVHPEKAPLRLQDHNGAVHFRNVWVRELTSPWKEDLVSGTSAVCRKAVAEQRLRTAEKLLQGLDSLPEGYERLEGALEMLSYSTESKFLDAATRLADDEAETLPYLDKDVFEKRVKRLKWYFDKMRETHCLPSGWKLLAAVEGSRLPKVSVFSHAIENHAKEKGLTIAEVERRFYDVGVRGFDTAYCNPLLDELAKGPLKPINLFGWIKFRSKDGGRADSDAFVAQAVKYGVPRIMVIPDSFTKDGDKETEFKEMVEGLRYLAQKAKASGVTAMIEDYGGDDNPCSYSTYLKRFLTEIPELSYALDAGNLHHAGRGEDILEMMKFAEGRIAHVHLKDFQKGSNRIRITIGIGEIPNERIVREQERLGYGGWYTLEDLVGDRVDDAVRQVGVLRRWCASAGE